MSSTTQTKRWFPGLSELTPHTQFECLRALNPYLVQQVLIPLLHRQRLQISQVDFSKFDEEDLENADAALQELARQMQQVHHRVHRLLRIPAANCRFAAFL